MFLLLLLLLFLIFPLLLLLFNIENGIQGMLGKYFTHALHFQPYFIFLLRQGPVQLPRLALNW